jgi:hypothetical protein
MRNLIICPVGIPITFSEQFDAQEHWRYTKQKRNYETMIICYKDSDVFFPEKNTYDHIFFEKGEKCSLIKNLLKNIDYTKYEYIGFFDDDLITDIDNINGALEFAHNKKLKIFQLSLTSDSEVFHRSVLGNDTNLDYSTTTFIEIMGPFIHSSLIPLVLEFWNEYNINSGWGFDIVLKDITKTDLSVIHRYQMYHPKKESSYSRDDAAQEMRHVLLNVCPKFMKKKYNEDWNFLGENIRVLKLFLRSFK